MSQLSNFRPPIGRLEVLNGRTSGIAMILLVLIFGGLSAALILSGHSGNGGYLLVLGMLGLLSVISFLVVRARRTSVRVFDTTGIIRGDGRHFPWSEFKGVVRRKGGNRYGAMYVWRIELHFTGGQAWVLPAKIRNAPEVMGYVGALPKKARLGSVVSPLRAGCNK